MPDTLSLTCLLQTSKTVIVYCCYFLCIVVFYIFCFYRLMATLMITVYVTGWFCTRILLMHIPYWFCICLFTRLVFSWKYVHYTDTLWPSCLYKNLFKSNLLVTVFVFYGLCFICFVLQTNGYSVCNLDRVVL